MDRWKEIDRHPDGFVLCAHWELKPPRVALRLGHLDWVGRRKRDAFVWLNWIDATRKLVLVSNSPTTRQFPVERPDVYTWVAKIMAQPPRVNGPARGGF